MIRSSKIFIDQTAWYALLDKNDEFHGDITRKFNIALDDDAKLFTSNIAIGEAMSRLKENLATDVALKFNEIVEEAHLGNHLRILWIGRRTQKEAIRAMRKNADVPLHLYDFAHIVLMEKRRIKNILSTKAAFADLGYGLLIQTGT